ncbi:LD-carboxypeptidase, partial [bacterium]
MNNLIKPKKLEKGDLIATVSLSWGGAGDEQFRHRYQLGKKRLEEVFGLKVIEMTNSLK